jgi:DMSO/TMAO reductase YedYZ molybdopterin-dependent catalytic subunit
MAETNLTIDGEVETRLTLSRADMAALPDELLVPDVSQIEPRRQGRAVQLNALLDRVAPAATATHLTLHASTDDFAASIPLDAVRGSGLLIFEIDGEAVHATQGGPYRFLIPNAAACQTAELDACANVKFLDRIELTAGKGRDTR